MTHTIREKHKLLGRVRRIRGQVEAIERALDGEAECEQVMHLIGSVRGAIFKTFWRNAWMCAGVVPQQPPTAFSQPCAANSASLAESVWGSSL